MPMLSTSEGLLGRIIEAAPAFELSEQVLRQTVSWSDNGPISLGEYISATEPRLARQLALTSQPSVGVAKAEQLSDDELKKVALARLDEGADGDMRLAVLGQGIYSADEIKREIEAGTDLGQRLIEAERRNISLLEQLVKAGKVRLPASELRVDMPEFDF